MHGSTAFRAFQCDFIDVWTMKFYCLGFFVTAHLEQFLTASDGMHMSALTLPDVQWCSPVTVSGNTPVLNVFQPVTETSFTNALRNPVNCIVVADQVIFNCCHLDKPGFTCIVDQWCITSPAVRIIMLEFRSIEKFSFFIQILKYKRICFLDKNARIWSFCCHITFTVYKLYERKVIIASYTAVVFTECRCDMNDTGTIAHSYIIVCCNKMSFLFLFCCRFSCACEEWLIFFVFQIFSDIFLKNFVCRCLFGTKFAENFVKQSFCHIISIAVCCFYLAVNFCRVYAECNVGWQCPRCCGPCQEVCIFSDNFKTNDCRTFFNCFISLGNFLCRKRSTTTRAVRNDLESFVKKFFIPDFFQSPPF